jgi:uracil-DNA glycosylase family 4
MPSTTPLEHRLHRSLYDSASIEFTAAAFPLLDFNLPGMPIAGQDFVAHANNLGDTIDVAKAKKKKEAIVGEKLIELYRKAMYQSDFEMPVLLKGKEIFVRFLRGHVWGEDNQPVDAYGPRPARVMVVGKMPGKNEQSRDKATTGPGIAILKRAFAEVGLGEAEFREWYVTFACKFSPPDEDMTVVPAAWIKDCSILLEQEIRYVQPEYILCLGNEATKAVLGVSGSVTGLGGRVIPHKVYDQYGTIRDIKVMPIMHPAYVARKPEVYEDFCGQVSRFKAMLEDRIYSHEDIDHADIYTEDALVEMVNEMVADTTPNANIIAVDCEWNGDHPGEPNAYLRTIQVSNKDKWARTIVLRYQGGEIAFKPDLEVVRRELNRLLKSTPERHVRLGGHFLRADLPWLMDFGVDARAEYAPAEDPDERMRGGWDTSLMYHAINECARYGLDECVMRFTTAPTYWEDLDKWKKQQKTVHRLKTDEFGYGDCPPHILHPYASYDADVTRRIMMKFFGTNGTDGMLACDAHGHDCWLPYWTAHNASLAFLEMELTGLEIDRNRADELTTLFMNTQDRLLAEIREELNWPAFNPKSQPQLAVALFGREFGLRYTNAPDIPEDANTLDLQPVKTTGKRPVLWAEMHWRGIDADTATPSTDKESLGILGHINSTAAKIRDYKFTSQVLQSVLRKPSATDEGVFEMDENGNYTYEKGLVGCVHKDGKVRTHMFQTKETGRASSSRPPLQNLSSRRENDYKRILGADRYKHPVRSILRVPEGCVGIETDLTGAELAVLAWLAQDANMIEHVRRNILPEKHPDHYDIHSQQAVKTFNLRDVEPTKHGLEAAGKKGMRIAAKNVNFGIPYGRGPEAIARQCREEGVDVTPEDCQAMIEAYFDSYPKTKDFLAECRARSQDPGWIVGPYGRFRRFVSTNDRAVKGEQERQAQNFPIQGGVADAVSIALFNFLQYREQHPDVQYQITLQIHDAIVLTAPVEHAERVYKEVVPKCMVDDVPFYPRRLDGTLIDGQGPYHFGADRDVFVHWGEKLTQSAAEKIGLNWLFSEG